MSLPAIVLSLVFASLYAGLFHFAFARRAAEIGRYWLASVIGFLLGAVIGLFVPWRPLVVGEVHLLEGTLVSMAALFLARWLGGGQPGAT